MENALALSQVMGPMYLLLGLSMLMYAKSWHQLVNKWVEDHLPLFTLMLVEGVLGVIAVNMYNVWEWNVWLIVTVTGWWMVVESVFFFLAPGSAVKEVLAWYKKMGMIYACGILCAAAGAVLSYYVYLV